jgi:predicted ATPase
VGEAGVGKSRLVHEFRRTLAATDTLEVQALPYGRSMPYHAFIPLLRALLGLTGSAEPWQQRQQIRIRFAAIEPMFAHAEPLVANLFGILLESDQLSPLAPEEQKRRLQRACQ